MNVKEMCFMWILLLRTQKSEAWDKCSSGKFQSPIEIKERPEKFTLGMNNYFNDYYGTEFIFKDFEKIYEGVFRDDNKTYELSLITKNKLRPSISGGPFGNNTFFLHKFYFHWKTDEKNEKRTLTEHFIADKTFDGEIQMVAFNSRYGSFEKALQHESDGLVAFVSFIEETTTTFRRSLNLFALRLKINVETSSKQPWYISRIVPKTLLSWADEVYVMYNGSLTMTPCTEIVKWIIFPSPISVRFPYLTKLRKVLPGYTPRPLQDVNKRKFYYKSRVSDHVLPRMSWISWKPTLYKNLTTNFTTLTGKKENQYCYKSHYCKYHPLRWKEIYPMCGSDLQSPINIDQSKVKKMKRKVFFPSFNETKYGDSHLPLLIHNASIYIYYAKGLKTWEFFNKLNNENYFLNRIKIQIGNENGSEHSIDSIFYPIEIQLYNINKKFRKDITKALNQPNGIFIISKFFDISEYESEFADEDNEEFKKIIPSLTKSFRYLSDKSFLEDTFIENLDINKLLGHPQEVFMYNGSLSEPPCSKKVTWMIIKKVGYILPSELNKIVTDYNKKHFERGEDFEGVDEKRPTQNTEGRPVYIEKFEFKGTPPRHGLPSKNLKYNKAVYPFKSHSNRIHQNFNYINLVCLICISNVLLC
ncbi:UNVERIFIED_CONTAM: hypothetical protein RMT77_005999 [Armadillidium vulgare]